MKETSRTGGRRLVCGWLALAAALASAQNPEDIRETFPRRKTPLDSPNPVMAANLVRDEVPEIIATDVRGRMLVFDAATGETILSETDSEKNALTAPVVGEFRRDASLEIAAGTKDGRVVFRDGGSLRLIAETAISEAPFVEAPTVARLPRREDPSTEQDVLLLINQAGEVFSLYLDSRGAISEYWPRIKTGTKASAPLSVGRPRSAARLDIAVPTSDGKVILIDALDGRSTMFNITEKGSVATTILMADFDADGRDDLVFTLNNGDIEFRRYNPSINRLDLLRSFPTGNQPNGDPVMVGTQDAPAAESLVFQGGTSTLVAVGFNREGILRGNTNTFVGINTHLSVIPNHHGGFPAVVFGQGTALRIVDTSTWFQGAPRADYPACTIGEIVSNTVPVVAVPDQAAAGSNSYTYHLVGMTATGRLFGFNTTRSFAMARSETWPSVAPWLAPWSTRAASPRRNARTDLIYLQRESLRAARLEKHVASIAADLEAARGNKNWDDALAAARALSEYDPFNLQYRTQYRQTWIRRNIVWLSASAIALLLLLALVAYLAGRFAYLTNLERKARAAVARGQMPEAETLYEKLLARRPGNPKVIATLAMVYMTAKNYGEKTIDVYRRARERDTGNPNLLNAYAQALVHGERRDDEARAVFEQALKTFPEPQLLEYAIGICHKEAGNFEEAAKRLRAALRAGLTSDAVYSALCDVYLATNNRTAKALPVYQHQFPLRQDDGRFLEAYLDSCIEARKGDSEVESLCHLVLEHNSRHVPAYCHLATIHVQKNETGRAIEEVNEALRHEPDNPRAITLLAQCYLIEGRADEAACQAFRRALRIHPEDAEILRTLAEIHFRAADFTPQAIDIYSRSRRANPADATTLRALAEAARLAADHDLAIDVLETIAQLGFGEVQFTRQLARAYIARGVFGTHTEKVFREALRAEPDNPAIVQALASVLAAREDDSADAIPVYELQLKRQPGDGRTGTMLVRAYIKNSQFQDALAIAQQLLARFPGDGELQRLVALASLYDNKLDEAIAEYTGILQRNPGDEEAQFHLAMAYAHKGRTDDECARLYQRALAFRAETPELHTALARVHLERNDTVKAVECYQNVLRHCPGTEESLIREMSQMLQRHPDALRVRWFLCELLVAYGHLREAMEQLDWIYDHNPNHAQNVLGALDKILGKDPQSLPALQCQARILSATGDLPGARAALEKAYKLQPNSPEVIRALAEVYERLLQQRDDVEVRFRLGRLYYMIQDYDRAIGNFQKTAQDYRREAESIKMLGKCFTNKGMLDLALQEFKKLVVDEETKELLYDLAQRYEAKKDLVGAKTVYRQLFAADIDYKDVKTRFEMLSGSTSDPMAFEKTSIVQQMSEDAKRRYELLDELGRGAMGIVYRARDKELEEVVALKILPDAMSNNPEAVRRFKIEARNARRLSHPNIVRIHDIGEEMGRKYISMEYVDGSDLKRKVKSEGRLAVEDIFRYGIDIADALGYAHRLGIVHRDIKPANIMITSANQVKITDFGIAKLLDGAIEGAADHTMVGAVIGTPLYMSPEQVQGLSVDNRADIYSYGIMLYEFISGRPPFYQGDLAFQHINTPPQKPENCPEPLWAVVARCLAKKKEERWERGEDIVEALKTARREVLGV